MTVTVKHPFVSTVPDSTDTSLVRPSNWNADHTITGLGTAAELNAGVANGVATLDAGGKVPVSQIPALGDLNYQGTWNASTNSPTLTSSTGTKGYYYVVNVAGSTNLDGITDWQVGDWAVFNGSVWQKIDNTDAVTSVNGYTGAVVLGYADVGAANSGTNTNITSMTGITGGISTPDYIAFDTAYSTTLTAGQLGWDGNNTLAIGMAGGNVIQHIGEDSFFYIKASSAITKGQLVMFTGAVGASGVLTGAPSTGVTNPSYIMGVAAETIALNGFGLVQCFGELTNVNTNGFNEGDILYYDSAVTGGLTSTYPTSGIIVQVAAVAKKSAGGGVIYIRVGITDRITASTGISISQNGTGVTVTNSAPDQTVAIASGTGISVTGTYPNFTVTNTSPSSGGTVTSITAGTGLSGGTITSSGTIAIDSTVATLTGAQTLTNKTISGASNTLTNIGNSSLTNSAITINGTSTSLGGSISVGTVTSVTGTAPVVSSGGNTPAISMAKATGSVDGYLSATDWTTFNNKGSGTVTSVTATSPVTSTGGTTPVIAMPAATGSVNGYLTSTDWTTFNNKGSGTVTSVSALTLGTTGTDLSSTVANGTTTPVITLNVPTASATNRGALSAADWSTFNGKAPSVTYTTNYIPYGQGTTTPALSSNLQYDPTLKNLIAPQVRASNGIVVNSQTVSANFTIASGDSAMSSGPMTVASGVTVTISSGSRWVVL